MGEIIAKVNYRKIISDIFYLFFISCGFTIILFVFSYNSNEAKKVVVTLDNIINETYKIFYIFLSIKICFELFMTFSLDNYDGWLKGRNIVYERTTSMLPGPSLLTATNNNEIAVYNHKIISVHEAGHALMCYIMNIEDFTVKTSYTNSFVTVKVEKLFCADDLKKLIYIDYSGAIAEELITGNISVGSMGSDKSDFEQAIKYIKQFIILTDSEYSKTGLDEGINTKIVELSKLFYKEAKAIMIENKEEIEKLACNLYEHKTLTKNDIEKILAL